MKFLDLKEDFRLPKFTHMLSLFEEFRGWPNLRKYSMSQENPNLKGGAIVGLKKRRNNFWEREQDARAKLAVRPGSELEGRNRPAPAFF
jgi:hypothetical protein